jgi:hypothetical protein
MTVIHTYERALVDGDVAVLTELFWDDPRCVRFGVADGSGAGRRSQRGAARTRRCRGGGCWLTPTCSRSTTGRPS